VAKLDEAIAVVFEERGGQAFAYDEEDIKFQVNYHVGKGRRVWVFRKDESCSSAPLNG